MKSDRATQIGIDRLVRLEWLERTASLVLAGNTARDIKEILQNDISSAFQSGKTERRGSLGKTITILMKVWLTAPLELTELRVAGLELLKRLPKHDRKAVHWGMVMAVYPFWANVAGQVGRLLKIQESAVASQVQRRMREQYGERETVSRRTRYVLRSFVDWGVLSESKNAGVYKRFPPTPVTDRDLAAWLIETAIIWQRNSPMTLKHLIDSTSLFPFRIAQIGTAELRLLSSRLEVISDSIEDELVVLNPQLNAVKTQTSTGPT